MARDFDFRRTPTKLSSNKPVVATTVAAAPIKSIQPNKKGNNLTWLAIVVILAVFAVGVGLYYQSLQTPNSKTNQTTTESAQEQQDKKELVVDVFDGGGGADLLSATVAKLTENGFAATNSGKTQFEYDKTYIWYITGFETDAQKIATLLNDRKTVLKESKVSGAFTIQVQLGKE